MLVELGGSIGVAIWLRAVRCTWYGDAVDGSQYSGCKGGEGGEDGKVGGEGDHDDREKGCKRRRKGIEGLVERVV